VSAAAVVVVAAISTFGTVYVTYLQNKNSDQMARLETQVEILRSFQKEALSADISQRVRFAHLFSKLSPSEEDRVLWNDYYLNQAILPSRLVSDMIGRLRQLAGEV
jgi:hypothetical protein